MTMPRRRSQRSPQDNVQSLTPFVHSCSAFSGSLASGSARVILLANPAQLRRHDREEAEHEAGQRDGTFLLARDARYASSGIRCIVEQWIETWRTSRWVW